MRDKILEAGTVFDWISPLSAIAQDIIRGPSHTFLIPYDCGWSGRAIAGLLRSYGIRSWGHMVVEGTLMLSVSQNQAHWAHYLLERAGIFVENPPGGDSTPDRSAVFLLKRQNQLLNISLFQKRLDEIASVLFVPVHIDD